MTLEARLISNSNAFFTRKTKAPLVNDEYEKMFEMALMATKKPLPTFFRTHRLLVVVLSF